MSSADVSEEEQDGDGGAAIPPPAKRKVRGKETHSTIMIASNLSCVLVLFATIAEKVDL